MKSLFMFIKAYSILPLMGIMALNANASYIDVERDVDLSKIEGFSLIKQVESGRNDNSLIEPLSPVLGTSLVLSIKDDSSHPEKIFNRIEKQFPNYKTELLKTSLAYSTTLTPSLDQYCAGKSSTAGPWEVVDKQHASIPVNVLIPNHKSYIQNLFAIEEKAQTISETELQRLAVESARIYQDKKYNCSVVQKLNKMENKVKKFFPKRWDRLVDLNHKISSAEAAFPRMQFSINGYTQFVLNELLKINFDSLKGLLKEVYDAEIEWMKDAQFGIDTLPMISYVEQKLSEKYKRRDIILALSYSTRNMPSIDVHYAHAPQKALLLETYFWKLRQNRDTFSSKLYFSKVFPNKKFKKNPGFYHFMTAALLAYEVRCNKYTGQMAVMMSIVSKLGYKIHKLIKYINWDEYKKTKNKIKYITAIAKKQGFKAGVQAGLYGGRHGRGQCRIDLKSQRRAKREQRRVRREQRRKDKSKQSNS